MVEILYFSIVCFYQPCDQAINIYLLIVAHNFYLNFPIKNRTLCQEIIFFLHCILVN
jgi:hypothetical protein